MLKVHPAGAALPAPVPAQPCGAAGARPRRALPDERGGQSAAGLWGAQRQLQQCKPVHPGQAQRQPGPGREHLEAAAAAATGAAAAAAARP